MGLSLVWKIFLSAGVADQLQTNFASDMRAILKSVFELIVSRDDSEGEAVKNKRKHTFVCVCVCVCERIVCVHGMGSRIIGTLNTNLEKKAAYNKHG